MEFRFQRKSYENDTGSSVVSGSLTLLEHEAAAWLDKEHLRSVRWLPADEGVIDELIRSELS